MEWSFFVEIHILVTLHKQESHVLQTSHSFFHVFFKKNVSSPGAVF